MSETLVDSPRISAREQAIYEAVCAHWKTHWCAPTHRDIMESLRLSSTSVVEYNVDKLLRKGLLTRGPFDLQRALQPTRVCDRIGVLDTLDIEECSRDADNIRERGTAQIEAVDA